MLPITRQIIIIAACVSFCVAVAHTCHGQPSLSKQEKEQLKKGEIVLKEAKPHYLKQYSNSPWIAISYFNQTPTELAGYILDFQQYTNMFPKVKDLVITPLGDSRYRLKYTVASGLFTFRYTIIMTYVPADNMIWWDLDPEHPGDFSAYKGYWKFIPEGNKTMAVYSISPIAKLPVPDFMQQDGAKNEMPVTVKEVKDWIREATKPIEKRKKKTSDEWADDNKPRQEENSLLKLKR
ncbi:MAG TPA: hypothetical protein P5287_05080 [bacterium]|nr:hypothetical protein [bacterium]